MYAGVESMENGAHTPGDRYPSTVLVERTGAGDVKSSVVTRRVLAVAPYDFTFCAPVKGRWVGLPLLTVFAKEFAYIPPLTSVDDTPRATLDPRVTIPAYVEELRTGALWLRGREAECRAAGNAYGDELRRLHASSSSEENVNAGGEWSAEIAACSETEAMGLLLAALSPRLVLRQKDAVLHKVLRREAPMPCDEPLHILRYDHVPRGSPPRRLLHVRKPHGVPVHPSGRFRKNSVTSILEDVFGGVDADRYCAVPLKREEEESRANASPSEEGVEWVAICHKQYGFELIRVWIGEKYVSRAAWEELQLMLARGHSRKLKVFVVHRLDIATSGVLLFGIDSPSARITAELFSQKDRIDGGMETTKKVGCTKQYLARVRGRFDAEKISKEQHHCTCDCYGSSTFFSKMETEGADAASKTTCWLRVDRPIGCLSHHESLYWCPDAAVAALWLEDEAKKEEEQRGVTAGTRAAAGRKRTARHDAASLEAKHARMRELTVGGRVAAVSNGMEGAADEANTAQGDKSGRDQICQLKDGMKRAITLIRLVAYDVDSDESVVECLLLTGRTHQVRVHLASLGHPICGDTKYIQQAALEALRTDVAANSNGGAISLQEGARTREEEGDEEEGGLLSSGIFLHAWRYTLRYAADEPPERFEAPPPTWALTLTKTSVGS